MGGGRLVSTQDSYSVQISASAETLWALLQLERDDPRRFDDEISAFEILENGDGGLTRKITRQSQSWNEEVKLTADTLLAEHKRTFEDGSVMMLIHQLAPSSSVCDLNLASTWDRSQDSDEIAQSLQALEQRAITIKNLAEAIEQ